MKKEPDAIALLSAGIKQTAEGRWVSTDLTQEDDALGAPGGVMRVLAAALLAELYPRAVIVAMGGMGYDMPRNYPKNRPLLCEILRDELLDASVQRERIVLERESNSTYQQLTALAILVRKHGWQQAEIVTNRWHIPRVRAIIERKLPKLKSIITLVSAEDVLVANNSDEWESGIVQAYESEWLARRILMEEQGIRQIKDGTYNFK